MLKALYWLAVGELGNANELNVPNVKSNNDTLKMVLSAAFLIVGALSVIFIIVGGLQYVTSGGNPESTNKAKNTIMYAVIGLVVSVSAAAIVNFVVGRL